MPGLASAPGDAPRVTVLMATYNGRRWIDEQVDSILRQRGVAVTLVVSDDGSSDGTREHLMERSLRDSRIRVLPRRNGPPGVTANFLHLFVSHAFDGSYVAFSDQDDIWRDDKLESQLAYMKDEHADVVSSNVTSFDSRGRERLIEKNSPQRRWDHIFEAAGPGSTYVFSPQMHARLVDLLANLDFSQIGVHDWYLYALARAIGAHWAISAQPTVDYRQHDDNVQGANSGRIAYRARLAKLRSGFYLRQFILTATAVREVNSYSDARNRDLDRLIAQLENPSIFSRLSFMRRACQIRRNRREGIQLACARLLGVW